ncbi:MAG: hypothetical protein QXS29_09940 [Nitrososphaeria archaeon]
MVNATDLPQYVKKQLQEQITNSRNVIWKELTFLMERIKQIIPGTHPLEDILVKEVDMFRYEVQRKVDELYRLIGK